ncbi:MAG: VOC family protein [Bacillota bacterium]
MALLKFGSTYLYVKDMERSIDFYEQLFERKVSSKNFNRWAQFNLEHSCLALMNHAYDTKRMKEEKTLEGIYSKEYLEAYRNLELSYGNNFVLNYYTDNLNAEYARIKRLNIGEMSRIMYLNVAGPYYFFNLEDPDGNTIEITGEYTPESSL